jgi:hypothetical protein
VRRREMARTISEAGIVAGMHEALFIAATALC